jgi:hypothetical protein
MILADFQPVDKNLYFLFTFQNARVEKQGFGNRGTEENVATLITRSGNRSKYLRSIQYK